MNSEIIFLIFGLLIVFVVGWIVLDYQLVHIQEYCLKTYNMTNCTINAISRV